MTRRMCKDIEETIKLARLEYNKSHDKVAGAIHCSLA